jgi:hypothetical protein
VVDGIREYLKRRDVTGVEVRLSESSNIPGKVFFDVYVSGLHLSVGRVVHRDEGSVSVGYGTAFTGLGWKPCHEREGLKDLIMENLRIQEVRDFAWKSRPAD